MKPRKPKRTDDKLVQMIISRMKELRSIHNYTQEYVVEQTGLDIFHYENGTYVPTIISFSILCKFYNISLDEFFAPLAYPPKK